MSDPGALVYIVDDDVSAREGVARLVRSAGFIPRTFASAKEFLAAPRTRISSCLVLDVNLPDQSGIELQQELVRCGVQIPIIFLTGHGDIPMTVRALKAGAVDFLTKPVHDEDLLRAIRQCVVRGEESDSISDGVQKAGRVHSDSDSDSDNRNRAHELQVQQLDMQPEGSSEYGFEDIVGKSSAIKRVFEQVSTVAPTNSTVLLCGETGTGKELIARAIHNLSSRRDRTFVRINCAAIPSGLLESELFGHEKGAFTGALMQKKGRFELADRGSLFLDEIGDISLELQPKLLRAVQEQEFERLGSARTIRVDARIIAATHRDLPAMIRQGKFREDLFYRLNVFPIEIPPLRERRSDIPLLVNYFVAKLSGRMGKQISSIPKQVMEELENASWTGNVRELQNFIERAVILTQGDQLEVPGKELRTHSVGHFGAMRSSIQEAERTMISEALKAACGRVAGKGGAAERLGIKRTTLQNKIRKLCIAQSQYGVAPSDLEFYEEQ